ncbi:MFS transporter [Mucilaginibacter sp. CSA2-8R]|uniref:MFS transporter n=1 Tax=Mucilaginibacter sp. CSA2-8R TaxID=3141542 RepID=UPI00315D45B9
MNNSQSNTPAYSWALVAMLWVVAFLNYFDRNLITSMHDPVVADFKLNDSQFGLLTTMFLLSYGVLSPLGGYFADNYGRKKVICFSVAVWSAVTLWTGFVGSFHEMLVARVVMGLSEACYIPAALALITEYHHGRTRSLATGLHMSGLYVGLALGGLGGFIAEYWGWRHGFQLFGLIGVAYSVVLVIFLKDKPMPQSNSNTETKSSNLFQIFKELFAVRSFLVLMFYFCVLGIVNWLIYAWLPTFLKDHFHLGLGEAGISATGYMQIGSFAGILIGGLVADRWSKINERSRLYVVIIGFTIGAPFLFLMASTHLLLLAIAAMIVYGLARGFNDANLMPILCQVIDNRYIATGYGFLNFLSTIVGGLMVYAGGMLKDAQIDLSVIYQVSAVLMLLASLSLLLVKVQTQKLSSE